MQLETFLPRMRMPVRGGRLSKPPFRGSLCARFWPDLLLRAVSHRRGVTRVVGSRKRPLPIDDAIIGSIREHRDDRGCVFLEISAPAAGDAAQVQHCRLIVARDAVKRT